MKKLIIFLGVINGMILKGQNPNLSYIHYLLKGKNSPYSELKDEKKLISAYNNLKIYEPLMPKTPIDKLCQEIVFCRGKKDTESLRKYLAYTNEKDLLKCFHDNGFVIFVEGYSDDCCTYEDRYEFDRSFIKDWSVEALLIIKSIIFKEGFIDPYNLGHAIGVLLVDRDIISSYSGYQKSDE